MREKLRPYYEKLKQRADVAFTASLMVFFVAVLFSQRTASSQDAAPPDGDVDIAEARDTLPAKAPPTEPPPEPPEQPRVAKDTLKELRKKIDTIYGRDFLKGRTLSLLIVDDRGKSIYAFQPDKGLKPASTTKLFTTAAGLALLGEDHRFTTRVLTDGEIDEDGRLKGNLYLLGGHDPTWSKIFYNNPDFPLDQIAEQIHLAGVKRVSGRILAYGEFVVEGHRFGELDTAHHRKKAVRAFKKALKRQGITTRDKKSTTGTSPEFTLPEEATTELAVWDSLPLKVICSPINRLSHNEYADNLMRHIGYVLGGESSYEKGAEHVIAWAKDAGIDTQGLALNDGSGLSHDNRISARQLVSLVEHMQTLEVGVVWDRTLAVGGVNGTYRNRMKGADTLGRVFVKSGTLRDTISSAGYLINRYDGRRYTFALLMNEVPGKRAARLAHDNVVEAVAADLLEAGTRPASPTLASLINLGDHRAHALWARVEGAQGYFIYTSTEGHLFTEENRIYTEDTEHTFADLKDNPSLFIKVTAVNAAGESDPSDVYATRVAEDRSPLLMVDGNDRWQREPMPENTLGIGHDFLADYARSMTRVAYDSVANEVVASGDVPLSDYSAVLWSVGEESAEDQTFDAAEQILVAAYLESGGNLIVSGSETGYEMTSTGDPGKLAFYNAFLRSEHLADAAETYVVKGVEGIFENLPMLGFYNPLGQVVSYADTLQPHAGSTPCLSYVGAEGAAAIQYAGEYKLLNFGFPIEAIDSDESRAALLNACLQFFEL